MLAAQDLRGLSDTDLAKELEKATARLIKQRMGIKTNHLKDTHRIRELRELIARLKTIRTQRRRANQQVAETTSEASKKLQTMHSTLAQAQEPAKKKPQPKPKKAAANP